MHDIPLAAAERLTFAQAAQLLGRSVQSVWRWSLRPNRHGVRLRTCLVGSVRYTSRGWLEEFVRETTEAADQHSAYGPSFAPDRRDRIAAARRELARVKLRKNANARSTAAEPNPDGGPAALRGAPSKSTGSAAVPAFEVPSHA